MQTETRPVTFKQLERVIKEVDGNDQLLYDLLKIMKETRERARELNTLGSDGFVIDEIAGGQRVISFAVPLIKFIKSNKLVGIQCGLDYVYSNYFINKDDYEFYQNLKRLTKNEYTTNS